MSAHSQEAFTVDWSTDYKDLAMSILIEVTEEGKIL